MRMGDAGESGTVTQLGQGPHREDDEGAIFFFFFLLGEGGVLPDGAKGGRESGEQQLRSRARGWAINVTIH